MQKKRNILRKRQRKREKMSVSPIAITALLLFFQFLFIWYIYTILSEYQGVFSVLWGIVSVILALFIVSRKENSAYKISWIFPMCIFPIFGIMLYFIVKVFPGTKELGDALRLKIEKSKPYINQDEDVISAFEKIDTNYAMVAKYLYRYENFPIYANSKLKYYPLGELGFESIQKDILKAQRYIFIEFFIISRGYMLDTFLAILEKKASEGVEVRFMYDGTNMFNLPDNYNDFIHSKGIECKIFSPVKAIISSYQNNRDHRKIIVIDGKIGYTGGINIADEYINKKQRFGHWKDNVIRVEGEAVKSMTAMFLQMWNIDTNYEIDDYELYLTQDEQGQENKDNKPKVQSNYKNYIIPYGDFPTNSDKPAEAIYMYILFYAKEYVDIMTPYLIIDDELIIAMKFAVNRGVKVRLMLPGIADKKLPYLVAQGYFLDLLESGIEIYKYTKGFVHSKVFVSDDIISTVGTVNLDYRSLYLHFENGVFCYDSSLAKIIKSDFDKTLKHCEKMSIEKYKSIPILYRIAGRLMRIVAPIM